MRIDRQEVPGIGTLHAFTTRAGQRVGVIQRRDGLRTLALYRDDDPQAVQRAATFDADEAHHLVDLLHPAMTVEHVDPVPDGPCLARLAVVTGSPAAGRPLGRLDARAARVLALVRDGRLVGWPDARTELRGGDTLVVAGTPEGVDALAAMLEPRD
ncbi:TrkA C-terminal domain-containing protein [Phytohabitans sp. ZYX-F-186]|uniref:TrkA C-terminal domain-containing protein n=1 Tax=Phytohabitans maris TaxID=3071409 RepID=A0ABU0ZU87_9ACTN|nr:TrkA C-terminal domain-containing protein [Phytohabitans sp. ZYX-F-186]MDQ7910604.1 TrkA C-terminal domain-containing protein [Phytohabitans sp. ZYX-F-186]